MTRKQTKIENLGPKTAKILAEPVEVEEKVDGSQITFGLTDGQLWINSRGGPINLVAPDKMFARAVGYITSIQSRLSEGSIYCGEYLSREKHNVLNYDRVPTNNIMLFDVVTPTGERVPRVSLMQWADLLGIEAVPLLASGQLGPDPIRDLLNTRSVLGGHNIEGIVIKRSGCVDHKGHPFFVKLVSETFKEIHGNVHTKEHTKSDQFRDACALVASRYTTAARWAKARIHLAETGKLEGSPKDIGLLVKEIQADVLKECGEAIKEELFARAWKVIANEIIKGAPQWYKEQLLKESF